SLTASTTDGCNIVLLGLDLGPEDEIVTTHSEHFGLLGPLHASGARVVVVPPDPDAILAAVGARTRLVAASAGVWTPGPRLSQLAGLCAAIELLPEWAYQQSAATAARGRELLAPLVAVESGDATLVAFRPEGDEPAELVRRLAESGVVVREIPGTGLVRVSC